LSNFLSHEGAEGIQVTPRIRNYVDGTHGLALVNFSGASCRLLR
jgi:hypothetical protein